MPTGQPGTQRGFLQRRQRSASCNAPSRSSPSATSLKLWTRSSAGWCGMGARSGGMVLIFFGTRGPGGSGMASGSSHIGARRSADRSVGFGQAGQLRRLRCGTAPCAAFSSRTKRFWRSCNSSKLTRCPSKSAPSTQANFIFPPTVTRHDPHIPVPSTMIEFRLTMVGMPNGRVTSAARLHHRDRADGDHFADVLLVRQNVGQRVRHEALASVAAVVGRDDQLVAVLAELVLPEHEVADCGIQQWRSSGCPGFLYSRSCG